MKCLAQVFLAGLMFSANFVCAVTVDAQVQGPLLDKARVVAAVEQNLQGEIATVPELDRGGKHRLFVRVASRHVGPKSWFLYFTEVQLQRRVTDAETRRTYWASIHSAVLWGTVPSENEIIEALESMMREKVSQWTRD